MNERPARPSFTLLGLTRDGKAFRPSDWAERLCGVMAPYRPGPKSAQAWLSYSPYVMPDLEGDVRCVKVDGRINQIEPMAYSFLVNFARDNGLQVRGLDEADPAAGPAAD